MNVPPSRSRRTVDAVSNTMISVCVVVSATVLGWHHDLAPEGILAAYGIAAAVGGLPIVVKRDNQEDR